MLHVCVSLSPPLSSPFVSSDLRRADLVGDVPCFGLSQLNALTYLPTIDLGSSNLSLLCFCPWPAPLRSAPPVTLAPTISPSSVMHHYSCRVLRRSDPPCSLLSACPPSTCPTSDLASNNFTVFRQAPFCQQSFEMLRPPTLTSARTGPLFPRPLFHRPLFPRPLPFHLPLPPLCSAPPVTLNQLKYWPETVVAYWPQLTFLSLAANLLAGPIPEDIGDQLSTTLVHLDLMGNYFNGTVPSSISTLQKLRYIDLSFNSNLTGPVPEALAKINTLRTINLEGCSFTGVLPESYSRLPFLASLYLDKNGLDGAIPASYGYIPSLVNLYLSNNDLSGHIPESLCRLQKAEAIVLERNSIGGTIPACLVTMENLLILDVTGNYLKGAIPKVEAGSILQFLYAGNCLDGQDRGNDPCPIETATDPNSRLPPGSHQNQPLWENTQTPEENAWPGTPTWGEAQAAAAAVPAPSGPPDPRGERLAGHSHVGGGSSRRCCRSRPLGTPSPENQPLWENTQTPEENAWPGTPTWGEAQAAAAAVPAPSVLQLLAGGAALSGTCLVFLLWSGFEAPGFEAPQNQTSQLLPGGAALSGTCLPPLWTGSPFSVFLAVLSVAFVLPSIRPPHTPSLPSTNAVDWKPILSYVFLALLSVVFVLPRIRPPHTPSLPSTNAVDWKPILSYVFLALLSVAFVFLLCSAFSMLAKRRRYTAVDFSAPRVDQLPVTEYGLSKIKRATKNFTTVFGKGSFGTVYLADDLLPLFPVTEYGLSKIKRATKNFTTVFGKGSFGTVYLADDFLPDQIEPRAIVKRAHEPEKMTEAQFREKVQLLAKARHRYLVSLRGYCIGKAERILVFEFLPHGSLFDRLHRECYFHALISQYTPGYCIGKAERILAFEFLPHGSLFNRLHLSLRGCCIGKAERILVFGAHPLPHGSLFDRLHRSDVDPLPWDARVHVAVNLASALAFLHHGCDPPLVHRAVTSSNILLSADMSAKKLFCPLPFPPPQLSDFGLARGSTSHAAFDEPPRRRPNRRQRGAAAAGRDDASASSSLTAVGSSGDGSSETESELLQPVVTRTDARKLDIYGFGVVLLELITGQKAMKDVHITSLAAPFLEDTQMMPLMVDSALGGFFNQSELIELATIARDCVKEDPNSRPTMLEVVRTMEGSIELAVDLFDPLDSADSGAGSAKAGTPKTGGAGYAALSGGSGIAGDAMGSGGVGSGSGGSGRQGTGGGTWAPLELFSGSFGRRSGREREGGGGRGAGGAGGVERGDVEAGSSLLYITPKDGQH
ncbi:unnamed protein product [Closterium sp. NIES-65]|nr:unnamed protein product [Closterium sp. NIES-65]